MKLFSQVSVNGFDMEPYKFTKESLMEAFVLENPSVLKLQDDDEVRVIGRQVSWERNNDKVGRIDILACYNEEVLTVVELKKDVLTRDDFNQLKDYLFGHDGLLKETAEKLKDETKDKVLNEWMGVLVGSGIDDDLDQLLKDEKKSGDTRLNVLVLNRYKSGTNFYVFSDVYFISKKGRDYTKYSINGDGKYTKRGLVLELVKRLACRDGVTKESIEKDLFKGLFCSYQPNIVEFDKVPEKYPDYYFTDEKKGEPVLIGGVKCVVNNGWALWNTNIVIENASKMGFDIKSVEK